MKRARPSEITVHPAPEDLMSFLDGELDQIEKSAMERHLRSCKSCRETLGRFAEAAAEFSCDAIAPASLTPAGRWMAAETAAPRFRPMAVPGVLWNRSVAASIAVLLVGALVAHLALSPPLVSARGLVDEARKKQEALREEFPTSAMVRTLRVTKTSASGETSVERWTSSRTPEASEDRLEVESRTAAEIASVLPDASCRSYVPLSVEMLDCLIEASGMSVAVKESASEGAGSFEIDVSSLRASSNQFHGLWIVDTRDWRLRSVIYQIGGMRGRATYQIEEESFELIPAEKDEPAVPTLEKTIELSDALEPREMPEAGGGNTRAANRLLAFEALGAWGATPEDDLQIVDGANQSVRVDGIVESDLRIEALRTQLAESEGVDVAVITRADALKALLQKTAGSQPPEAREAMDQGTATGSPEASVAGVRSEGPLLAEILESRFGGDGEGKTIALELGTAVLEETQQLAFEARWLERLEGAFTPEEIDAMSAADVERLRGLRADWRQRIENRHEALRARVMGVLCPEGCGEDKDGGESETDETAPGANRWMDSLSDELALLKTMFVDAGYAPAGTVAEAIARWLNGSQVVSRALEAETRMREGVAISAEGGRSPRR